VKTQGGEIIESVDIRSPVGIEMEFEVFQSGHTLLPYYNVFNEEGVRVFAAVDLDPEWRGRHRPRGCYKTTAWIPGNLLSEGTFFVGASMKTTAQRYRYFYEREAVAFHVIDSLDGDSARGDYAGRLGGAVRPLLKWETEFIPSGRDEPTSQE